MLPYYLCRRGPYIYYFNHQQEGLDSEILNYINFISNLHGKLKVLQIEWSEYIKRNPQISCDELKKIYIYFMREKKHEIINPTKDDIDSLFIKCIQYFNKKIDVIADNRGCLGKLNPKYGEDLLEPRFIKKFSSEDLIDLEGRRRHYRYKKIKSSIYPRDLINMLPENTSLQLISNIYKKIIQNIKINIYIKSGRCLTQENINKSSPSNDILLNIAKDNIKKGGKTDLKKAYNVITTLINQSSGKDIKITSFIKYKSTSNSEHNLQNIPLITNSRNFTLPDIEKETNSSKKIYDYKKIYFLANEESVKLKTLNHKNKFNNKKIEENSKTYSSQKLFKFQNRFICSKNSDEKLSQSIGENNLSPHLKKLNPQLVYLSNSHRNLDSKKILLHSKFRKRKISKSTINCLEQKKTNSKDEQELSDNEISKNKFSNKNVNNKKLKNILPKQKFKDLTGDNNLSKIDINKSYLASKKKTIRKAKCQNVSNIYKYSKDIEKCKNYSIRNISNIMSNNLQVNKLSSEIITEKPESKSLLNLEDLNSFPINNDNLVNSLFPEIGYQITNDEIGEFKSIYEDI